MTLSAGEQRATKLALLQTALIEHGALPVEAEFVPAPRALGYRNRLRLKVDAHRVVRFFNTRKDLGCAVLEPALADRLKQLVRASSADPELFRSIEHLELRGADDDGVMGLSITMGDSTRAAAVERLRCAFPDLLVGARGDLDAPWQRRRIVDDVYAFVPVDAFIQINQEVNALLVSAVVAGAAKRRVRDVLDLFAGCGNFSLPLAASGSAVIAVELHEGATRAMTAAARRQSLDCAPFALSATDAVAMFAEQRRRFDLVLLDPPRAGLRDLTDGVLALQPRTIALCSCNPSAFARDVARLGRTYTLESVSAFDMFPQTKHLEVLGWLRRTSDAQRCHSDRT